VYGVHLWFVFAVLRGKHIGPVLGLQAGYAGSFVLSALVAALMLWLAGLWHGLKTRHPLGVRWGQAITVTAMIVVFVSL
jgi:hypothetical protein